MNDAKSSGLAPSKKALLVIIVRFWLSAAAPLVLVILIAWVPDNQLVSYQRLGLVQPGLAALVALTVVASLRPKWGRFANATRKGARSASSATIAVRLWMLCFALLFGAMLLSALVARLPAELHVRPAPGATGEIRIESTPGAGNISAAVRVHR
jgi:hypothetical protein